MRNIAYDNFTETAVRAYAGAGARRTGDILQLLIQRPHDFVREAGITPGEREDAMGFLARAAAATVMGPFFVPGTPAPPYGADLSVGNKGERIVVRGQVRNSAGAALGPHRSLAERAIRPLRRAGSDPAGA